MEKGSGYKRRPSQCQAERRKRTVVDKVIETTDDQ